jgi:hypothetical protein
MQGKDCCRLWTILIRIRILRPKAQHRSKCKLHRYSWSLFLTLFMMFLMAPLAESTGTAILYQILAPTPIGGHELGDFDVTSHDGSDSSSSSGGGNTCTWPFVYFAAYKNLKYGLGSMRTP